MGVTDFDYLTGELEVAGIPSSLQWTTPQQFLRDLVKTVKVRFPVGRSQKLVLAGPNTPTPDDVDKLWARVDRNNVPLGWFGFFDGQWREFYTVAPGEVRWVEGDSQNPPNGWQTIDENAAGVSAAVRVKLMIQYVPHPDDAPSDRRYQYFAVKYIGYRG